MSPRVLLVDDSSIVRRSLHRMFEQAGWEVCGEAENGRDAIEKARKLQPKVIVLDLSMPEMNGLTASRILKEILPSVKIILFTMYGNLLAKKDFHASGISAVISKDDAARLVSTAETLAKQIAA